LVDLFSDGNQSGNVQSSGGTNLQNLPGTPSPVTNPASQGEAVIERATGGTTPTEASPLKSRAKEPRVKVRLSPSQQVYLHAAKAWIPPDASVNGCRSLLYNRELYHVQCVNLVSSLDEEFYRGYPYKHRK
jgi:hypothetical protein